MNFNLDCVGSIIFINLELIIKAKVLFHVKQFKYGGHDANEQKSENLAHILGYQTGAVTILPSLQESRPEILE